MNRALLPLILLAMLLAPGIYAAGGTDEPSPNPTPLAAQAVRDVFRQKQYQFCHEPDYPLTSVEKEWCNFGAGDNPQACPSLHQACSNQATARQLELREPFSINLPELGLPLRALLWGLLVLGLALLVFALVRHFMVGKPREQDAQPKQATSVEDEAGPEAARKVETDVERLLERARAEAATGDFRAAIGDLYAALLRRLEGVGWVRVQPDQTNGDYLRRVKNQQTEIAGRMAEVVNAVEQAQFGEPALARERFEGVWMNVTRLLGERLGPLVVLGLVLATAACGRPRADWDHSPSGRAAVMAFLGKRGFFVHERLQSVTRIGESKARQLVLLPGAHLGDEEWKAVLNWVTVRANSLLIAGGSRKLPAWVGTQIVEQHSGKSEPIVPTDAATKRWGTFKARVPGSNRLLPKENHQIVLRAGHGAYALEHWLGGEADDDEAQVTGARVVVVADDYLFRNASLLVADNALALERLLGDGGTSVELAGDLTGLVASNPVESVKRARLGPVLLQLAAFLLLFFVAKGALFGRPVQMQEAKRREFAEHVRAVGLHYARAHAERHALACVGSYTLERLRERCGLHLDRSLSALAEAVAARTGRSVGEVMRLFLEARDAKSGVPAEEGTRDLETVAELCKLLEQTGGPGGHRIIQGHV